MHRIPDPDLEFVPIPDPGIRKEPDPGSRIRIRNTDLTVPVHVVKFLFPGPAAQELDEAARRRLVKRLYIPLPEHGARKRIIHNLLMKAVILHIRFLSLNNNYEI